MAEYAKLNPAKIRKIKNKYSKAPALFDKCALQLTVEEDPKKDKDGYLLITCTYCGRYFQPSVGAVRNRIQSLVGKAQGENRLYCSDGCKAACPIFHKIKWPRGFKKASSREVNPLIRQMCLAKDDYTLAKNVRRP